jgi:hypothetical protein
MYLQHNKHHDEILFYIEYDMKPLRQQLILFFLKIYDGHV